MNLGPLADLANLTGTTVVYREVDGKPEYVVVCGECAEVETIGLYEAMHAALQAFMREHRTEFHKK